MHFRFSVFTLILWCSDIQITWMLEKSHDLKRQIDVSHERLRPNSDNPQSPLDSGDNGERQLDKIIPIKDKIIPFGADPFGIPVPMQPSGHPKINFNRGEPNFRSDETDPLNNEDVTTSSNWNSLRYTRRRTPEDGFTPNSGGHTFRDNPELKEDGEDLRKENSPDDALPTDQTIGSAGMQMGMQPPNADISWRPVVNSQIQSPRRNRPTGNRLHHGNDFIGRRHATSTISSTSVEYEYYYDYETEGTTEGSEVPSANAGTRRGEIAGSGHYSPDIFIDGEQVRSEQNYYLDGDLIVHNFTCQKNTTVRGISLVWTLGNKNITNLAVPDRKRKNAVFYQESNLQLKLNHSDHGNILECSVLENPNDFILVYLMIYEPPTVNISMNSSTKSAFLGSNITLQCSTNGVPTPSISWIGPGIKNISHSEVLTFRPVEKSHIGTYTCIASNSFGKESRAEFNISLQEEQTMVQESQIGPIIGGVIGALLFILAMVLLAMFLKRNRPKKKPSSLDIQHISHPFETPTTIQKENEIYDDNVLYDLPPITDDMSFQLYEEIPANKEIHLPDDSIKIDEEIGEGSFGHVYRAIAENINGHTVPTIIAIKMLKENPTEDQRVAFMTEINICKAIPSHENIIGFHGSFYKNGLMGIIYDYASNGCLKDMLVKSRSLKKQRFIVTYNNQIRLTSRNLVNFAYQIACAMRLLASNGFIHKELAARNILLDENLVCKITHLSSARNITETHIYEMKTAANLPVRWLALESLTYNLYTIKSDIWSFGVLLWEIVTLGAIPYYDMAEGPEVKQNIENGYRMGKPTHCSEELFSIIRSCWESDPRRRPSFDEIVQKLEDLLRTDIEFIALEQYNASLFQDIAKDAIYRENWE